MAGYIDNNGDINLPKIALHAILAAVGLVLVFGFLFGTWRQIDPGERGIVIRMGNINRVIDSGTHAKFPFIEKVVKMDVRTRTLEQTQDNPLMAASSDLQDTRLAVVVNYHVDPTLVADIYTQYGEMDAYYDRVVNPLVVATIKGVASQYTAAEQVQKRPEMSAKALEALQAAFTDKGVAIEKADITNIMFSDAFARAIEEKVTAVQNAETAKNKLEQTKAEAQQRIEQARGEAEAIRIQAQAITQQGGEDYVKLKMVEKWNGQGCTTYCFGNNLQAPSNIITTR